MPKRKGRKPPKRAPGDMRALPAEVGAAADEPFRYTNAQQSALWNRLFHFIGVETRIEIVIKQMEARKLDPRMKQLARTLKRLGIYPPPADHADHKACRCEWCAPKGGRRNGRRSFPGYYVNADGRAFEHDNLSEKREIDPGDEGLDEELEKLRGSGGSVIKVVKGGAAA